MTAWAVAQVRKLNLRLVLLLLCVSGLLAFQAYAYFSRLSLSLGPRVIFEPWLLQRGSVLYENITDIHTPLLPLLLSLLGPVFSDGLECAKVTVVVLLSCTTLLTFLAGRRTAGWLGGLWVMWFFVTWSPTYSFGKLWQESLLALLYVLLLLIYEPCADSRSVSSCVLLGTIGGTAVLVKQHAFLVLGALLLWNGFERWRLSRRTNVAVRETVLIGLAATWPLLVFLVYHWAQGGTLKSFLYWTVGYALTSNYGTLAVQLPDIYQVGAVSSSFIVLPAAVLRFVDLRRRGDQAWWKVGWGLLLVGAGAATVYPRFEMYHLQTILPVVAWLSSWAFAHTLRSSGSHSRFTLGILLGLSAFWLVTAGYAYRPVFDPAESQRIWEYSDLVPLAEQIEQYVMPTDHIYIFPDSEATANLYYLIESPPTDYWTFTYPWYMLDRVKSRILLSLGRDPPEWVVYFPGRWRVERTAPEIMDYLRDQYESVAQLDWERGEVWLWRRLPSD